MYWKAMRWGGSAVIIILVVAAALMRPDAMPQGASPPAVPAPANGAADGATEPVKNFNLSP